MKTGDTISDEPIAARLAQFVCDLRYEDLSPEVVDATKNLVLDQLACELIGSTMPWVGPAYELVRSSSGVTPECTLVNSRFRCLAADAAFVNASCGQACELDDATYGSAGHIGTATVPAALSMGERQGIDGSHFLLAIVAGYEVMYRIMAAVRPYHRVRGFHSQSIGGPFAAAAAAGKILGLDRSQMTHAFGIAGSHACGPLEYDQSGGEVKRIHAGIAAKGGIQSALLASYGLTGPATIIEGRRGFCNVFADRSDISVITENLGHKLNIGNAWFKLFPAVGGVHTTIGAVQKLVEKHDIPPADVSHVSIGITQSAILHCAAIRQPKDTLSAQFCLPFSVALAICRRRNELSDYVDRSNWDDPDLVAIMRRVETYADPEAVGDRDFMSTVTVELKDGRCIRGAEIYPQGSPMNPATRDQLRSKFSSLSKSVLTESQSDELLAVVENLQNLHDIGELASLLGRRNEKRRASDIRF